jgi:hypothetical protein
MKMLRLVKAKVAALAVAVALGLGLAASPVMAQVSAVDVSAVVTGVGNQAPSVLAVGVAIFAIVVTIAAIRWIRRVIR